MRRFRLLYALCLLAGMALLFFFNSTAAVVLVFVFLLLPVVPVLLCRRDAADLQITAHIRGACRCGQTLQLSLERQTEHPLLACVRADLRVSGTNVMLGVTTEQNAVLDCGKRSPRTELPFTPTYCGEVQLKFLPPACRDFFGLSNWHGAAPQGVSVMVYPRDIPVQIALSRQSAGSRDGEAYNQAKRGDDPSEVYDMRDYRPGDNVSRIHWKLSGKLDTLVVKESNASTSYSTLLLFDPGFAPGGDAAKIDAAMALAVSVSEALLRQGVAHCCGRMLNGGLQLNEVADQAGFGLMRDEWLSWVVPARAGQGLESFLAERMERHFTRVLYLTVDDYPASLEQATQETAFTVLMVCDPDKSFAVRENANLRQVLLPMERLNGTTPIRILI